MYITQCSESTGSEMKVEILSFYKNKPGPREEKKSEYTHQKKTQGLIGEVFQFKWIHDFGGTAQSTIYLLNQGFECAPLEAC